MLYLERPETQRCAVACSQAGRFGYSDLKEVAHMEAYVLCIGLNGCRGISNKRSRVGGDGLKARMERRCGSPGAEVEAGEAGIRGVLPG